MGQNVNLGAGTKLSNLGINSQKNPETGKRPTVNLMVDGVNYDTGLAKIGAIIGDGTVAAIAYTDNLYGDRIRSNTIYVTITNQIIPPMKGVLPQAQLADGRLQLSYLRYRPEAGTVFFYEVSSDLETWTRLDPETDYTIVSTSQSDEMQETIVLELNETISSEVFVRIGADEESE